MKKVYLISWDDENHEPIYWLDENYLGCSLSIVIESLIDLGIPKGTEVQEVNITTDNFYGMKEWEQLFDYFQTIPTLDKDDVSLIVANKWEDFYKKNIKKDIDKQKLL